MSRPSCQIAVVIPCFQVREQILQVIAGIGQEVGWIYVVDDACPQQTGDWVSAQCADPRVMVITHTENQGVGGATLTGYRHAMNSGASVVVKIDGDGQMDPALIRTISKPLLAGYADYAKGNRFHRLAFVRDMPGLRLIGNAALSFMTKLSSGYWQIVDPTNGFTAIRRELLSELELDRIDRRYFFESDLLYHLNQIRAVVIDIPMRAHYGYESSGLRPMRVITPFTLMHLRNTIRRLGYSYLVRGFSLASIELGLGAILFLTGVAFGLRHWFLSIHSGTPATAGTVVMAALPVIVGIQMLLSWLNFDIAAEPRQPVHPMLASREMSGQHNTQ